MVQLKWKFWSWEACHVQFDVFWVSAYNLNTAAVKTDAHCCCNVDSSAWRKKTRQSQRTEFRVSASYAMKFREGEIEHCFYKTSEYLIVMVFFGVKSNGNKIWWVVNGIDLSRKYIGFLWIVKQVKVYLHRHEVNAKATSHRERFSEKQGAVHRTAAKIKGILRFSVVFRVRFRSV